MIRFYILLLIFLYYTNICFVNSGFVPTKNHPLVEPFTQYLDICSINSIECEELTKNITNLCIRMANEHAQLLLHDTARQLFMDAFYILPPNSTIGNLISRILSVHAFAQGDIISAQSSWKYCDNSTLINQRTLAAQLILSSSDGENKITSISTSKTGTIRKLFQYDDGSNRGINSNSNKDTNDGNQPKKSAADLFRATTRNIGSQPSKPTSNSVHREYRSPSQSQYEYGSIGMELLFNYTNKLYDRFLSVMLCNENDDDDSDDGVVTDTDMDIDTVTTRNTGKTGKTDKTGKSCIFYSYESYIGINNESNTPDPDHTTDSTTPTSTDYGYMFPSYKKASGMLHKEEYSEDIQDRLLGFLFQEAEGLNIRLNSKLDDVLFSITDIKPQTLMLDSRFRFYLGVGLAKLGLFELSLGHMINSATPWEAALYRFRAQLVFSPIYSSIFALAQAVDNFERQAELLIMKPNPTSDAMTAICNSPNEIALALQSLPLLSLTGYSAPRDGDGSGSVGVGALGHSPVAIPVLLSEVYMHMCPPAQVSTTSVVTSKPTHTYTPFPKVQHSNTIPNTIPDPDTNTNPGVHKIIVGVVGGSFDSYPGRIVAGLVENMLYSTGRYREKFHFIAMCFPTPRDSTTDRMLGLGVDSSGGKMFDSHVNLSPANSTLNLERILNTHVDILIYADAGYDSRVFALAHTRLAMFQIVLWGWGCNTLGIPTIDYYIVPEVLFDGVRCKMQKNIDLSGSSSSSSGSDSGSSVGLESSTTLSYQKEHPQAIFHEQVVVLSGMPPIMRLKDALPTSNFYRNKNRMQLLSHLESRYLLPTASSMGASAAHARTRSTPSTTSSSSTRSTSGSQSTIEGTGNPHYYIFPGSVKHMHPEFDPVLKIILTTDPNAVILLVTIRIARDNLPVTHVTVKHDLMHPTMPIAAVTKLKKRLRNAGGINGDAIK